MAEFPALPLWTDAYLGDTTHLTTIEHGAFLLLLITAWRSKTHDLPDDDEMLARYTRMTKKQWLNVRPTILAFFNRLDGRLSNSRLLDELDAVRRHVQQRADAGKSSALKRLHRNSTAVPTGRQREGNTLPIPIPTIPTTVEPRAKGKRDGRGSGTRLAEDWELTDARRGYAQRCQVNPDNAHEAFCDHWWASDQPTAWKRNWDAAWRTWCRRERKDIDGSDRTSTVNGRRANQQGSDGSIVEAVTRVIARRGLA